MLNLSKMKQMEMPELLRISGKLKINNMDSLTKKELLREVVKEETTKEDNYAYGEGFLEVLPDGYGFLRSPENNYRAGLMTSMFRLHRLRLWVCVKVIRFVVRFARRKTPNAIMPC
jgi:transcription termination factor Rho